MRENACGRSLAKFYDIILIFISINLSSFGTQKKSKL